MINYIWSGLIVISFAVAAFTGKIQATTQAAFDGAGLAVTTCLALLGIICLWSGIMKIGEKSGLVEIIAKALRPVTKLLFPKLPKDSPALHAIVMNMVANLFGKLVIS